MYPVWRRDRILATLERSAWGYANRTSRDGRRHLQPSTAQRPDQHHRRVHPLAGDLARDALIRQQRRLREDDVEVADQAAAIAIEGDLQGLSRGIGRGRLRLGLALQNAQ